MTVVGDSSVAEGLSSIVTVVATDVGLLTVLCPGALPPPWCSLSCGNVGPDRTLLPSSSISSAVALVLSFRFREHGGNKPGTCLLPGMCFTFWKEGFYEARQRVTDTERTDL